MWTLELDQTITNSAREPSGLVTINGNIYIFSQTNLKKIYTTSPYSVTQINNIGKTVSGTSQPPSCNNVTFVTGV